MGARITSAETGRTVAEVRRDHAARTIVKAWRDLSGAAPTLVACSGGADSTALALTLAAAGAPVTLAHVVHDMRPAREALGDRDWVEGLAQRLGVGFVEACVQTGRGNAEDAARRARYTALAQLAREQGAGYVASAHHADDQLETLVMALVRGAGAAGLSGAAPARAIGTGVTLVRPMLGAERADAERICALAGEAWREDATNADRRRLRAALRMGPLAEIKALRPHAARRASDAAQLVREANAVVAERAVEVFGEGLVWERAALKRERGVVLGAGLRAAALRLTGGRGADRLSRRTLGAAVVSVLDRNTHERRFLLARGAALIVGASSVRMEPHKDAER